ncbi:hypothetical protein Bca101_061068 [Brassica carinata]
MAVFKSKELKLCVFSLLSDLSLRRIQRSFCELWRLASPPSSRAPLLSPLFLFFFPSPLFFGGDMLGVLGDGFAVESSLYSREGKFHRS